MLRTDAHTLPGAEWRAKCVKSVQWLQATVRNMRNASPDAVDALLERMNSVKKGTRAESGGKSEDTAISDSAMSQDEVLRWEDVSGATIVACEVMLCEMHAVLRESCSEVCICFLPLSFCCVLRFCTFIAPLSLTTLSTIAFTVNQSSRLAVQWSTPVITILLIVCISIPQHMDLQNTSISKPHSGYFW